MAVPTPKVEIGFDVAIGTSNLFTLDDNTKGRLDNTTYRLAGNTFVDVTSKVRSISTRRGKNRQLDEFDAGLANVVFDNNDRTFDPEYALSPYAGQLTPKKSVRITSGGKRIFTGAIDDWGLLYEPAGDSQASIACSDAFTLFNTQTLPSGTAISQTSGERINSVLNLPDVNWPIDARSIDKGKTELFSDEYPEDGNVLSYLQTVAKSEPGNIFIDALGNIKYTARTPSSGGISVTFADDGTGIPYQGMKVVYGSELLFNEIVLGSSSAGTVVAQDPQSISNYGVLNLTQNDLLISDADYIQNLAAYYAIKYGEPEYRFESIDVVLDDLSPANQDLLLNLEISDFVTVKFTPNGIGPAIEKVAEIIRIDHDIAPSGHIISFGFATVDKGFWTLSDGIFGRLSAGNVLGF